MNNGYRMDNGMIEDDYFTFERDNITYHFFHKPTQKTEKGQYGILAVDYGIRFDKEPYKDEKGHTVIPMSRVHSKPQQVAYFEFTEDSHPEIVEAMMEEDRKEYRDLIVAETQKHTKETIDEEFVNEDEFDSYISGIFERLKSINADMDDIEGKVTDDRLCLAFYSNIDKKESSKFSSRAEKLITDYLENETRFKNWIEIHITPADKFFYNTHNDNLKSFVIEIKAESSQDSEQHNESLDESNELKQRAKKHSKKQKGMSPFISLNVGNVEKGIEVFNSSVADGSGMAMCEDMDKQTYHYEGPIYYNGHKEASKTDIYTRATSIKQARNNILYRISGGKDIYKFDIVDNQIEEVIDDSYEEIPHDPHNKCDICGNLLNNNNECPRCDYGEYDLDESIQVDSNLDAMSQLNRLD